MRGIIECLEENPIIAAVKDDSDIEYVLKTDVKVIFMLFGSILNIKEYVDKLKRNGRRVFVHIDLINGLGKDEEAVKFLGKIGVDGIITTKPTLIKAIKNEGLISIQRLFMIDSRSLETGIKSIIEDKPHAVEIMPGLASKVIGRIHEQVHIPIIVGGLMCDKFDIISALSNGALAISTSTRELWNE
ncbi:glycerol-3-phosphate responsive antiterminator [Thermobrachium celere]|uniref:Glycerol uptake operon antiterminator regulatory protein n=1 Tax=Thermobrachium celere DSM 8682 TaxID=941824 RepID=R7RTQ7_9CLOT|nr:glycerol-3-phosphate responsive antiterminator [Thermobrachium celere]CDF58796.1 Glycerol uptake operon antiterminator regulatory protein [Thermobrachium celere DSM 8682]